MPRRAWAPKKLAPPRVHLTQDGAGTILSPHRQQNPNPSIILTRGVLLAQLQTARSFRRAVWTNELRIGSEENSSASVCTEWHMHGAMVGLEVIENGLSEHSSTEPRGKRTGVRQRHSYPMLGGVLLGCLAIPRRSSSSDRNRSVFFAQ